MVPAAVGLLRLLQIISPEWRDVEIRQVDIRNGWQIRKEVRTILFSANNWRYAQHHERQKCNHRIPDLA